MGVRAVSGGGGKPGKAPDWEKTELVCADGREMTADGELTVRGEDQSLPQAEARRTAQLGALQRLGPGVKMALMNQGDSLAAGRPLAYHPIWQDRQICSITCSAKK
jgi:hypothetical protein